VPQFRGFLARWHVLHPKLHAAGMVTADKIERDRGWGYYLREWQALDIPVELYGVTKKLTTADLEWAASTFQKCWRGHCARHVLRRSRVKEMEATLAGAATDIGKRWACAKERPCWVAAPYSQFVAYTEEERDEILKERCAAMVRRSTLCYYFTAAQASSLLAALPSAARLECLIALWAMVTDLENLHVDEILEGTDPDELMDEAAVEARKAEFYQRVGICNGFNPYLPDGHYVLNLRHPGQRSVAEMLLRLSDQEPGENILGETYNGVPFDVGSRWVEEVPDIGEFTSYYNTKPGCAHLGVRIELANRLLMPGKGRWHCIPKQLVVEDHLHNPDCFEIDGWDEAGQELDDDGTLHPPPPTSVAALREAQAAAAAAASRSRAAAAAAARAAAAAAALSAASTQRESEAKLLHSHEVEDARQKLRAMSYSSHGQDPHSLLSMYDKDRSGELSWSEFQAAVRKGGKLIESGPHGLSDHQLRKLFSAVDGDQSGAVSINELTKFLLKDEAVVQRS
jgi:hypothetical protein